MRDGWTNVSTSGRWVSVWKRKQGFIGLNSFVSGNWSITCKNEATEEDPHGIITSSFIVDRIESDLVSAMQASELEAKKIGAIPLGSTKE